MDVSNDTVNKLFKTGIAPGFVTGLAIGIIIGMNLIASIALGLTIAGVAYTIGKRATRMVNERRTP